MTTATQRGMTLVELLVTLAVIALMVAVGIPGYRSLTEGAKLTGRVAMYTQALHTARYLAVSGGRGITLCALDTTGHCTGNWGADLALFRDNERAGVLAAQGDLIAVIGMPPGDSTNVRWRGFGENRFLHVRASGSYRQNGRFTFCPSPARAGDAGRSVVVNVTGRTRVERYSCP